MSKSKGNFRTIRELLKIYKKETIRYFFASTNYRKPLDFSAEALENAKNSVERLKNIVSELRDDGKLNEKYLEEFQNEVDDEINLPNGLKVLWKLARDENAAGKLRTIKKIDGIFGFGLGEKEKISIPPDVKKLLEEREKARGTGDFKKADEIRNRVKKLGYWINDTEKGGQIRKL
jgi:cysteinyl-tRNA synthetase